MTLKDGKTGMTRRVDSIGESGLKERLMTMGTASFLAATKLRLNSANRNLRSVRP